MHISFYFYIIVVCITAGLVRFRSLNPPVLRWLVPFLIITLVVEITGFVLSIRLIRNHGLYNYFTSAEFIFYSLFYRKILKGKRIKKIIIYATAIYLILFILNILFVQGFQNFHTITYRIGSVMIVTWCYIYFRQLMKSEIYMSLFRNPLFWISSGLLFFYAGFFFWMSADVLLYINLPYNGFLWYAISDTLNIILYSCFLISFICLRNTTKK
jgi:hypothetical protein